MPEELKDKQSIQEAHKPGNYIQILADYYDDHAVTLLDQIVVNFRLRQNKTQQRLSTLESLSNYDQQVKSALNYLALHPETAKILSLELLENAQQELCSEAEAFAAGLMALHNGDQNWIEQIINGFLPYHHYREGLAYALAWLPIKTIAPWVKSLLASKNLNHLYLGVRVCSLLNQYPQQTIHALIQRDDCQQDFLLYKALLSLVGQMKDSKLYSQLVQASTHENPQLTCMALWARLMLGDKNVNNEAVQYSLQSNDCFHQMSPWLIRLMTMQESRYYLSLAFKQTDITMDVKILAMAAYGDPSVITWMLQNIQAPALMPWLGLAFHQITGVDITQTHLDLVITDEDVLEELRENDEEPTFLEEDLSLPYPKKDRMLTLWRNMLPGFSEQERYFLGHKIKIDESTLLKNNANAFGFERDNTAICNSLYNNQFFYSHFVLPKE